MYLTYPVSFTRVKQNPLRGGCFTRVDVSHDTNIPGICEIPFSHYI
jgi:hypothetical protein